MSDYDLQNIEQLMSDLPVLIELLRNLVIVLPRFIKAHSAFIYDCYLLLSTISSPQLIAYIPYKSLVKKLWGVRHHIIVIPIQSLSKNISKKQPSH
jgi:hypothetical protein